MFVRAVDNPRGDLRDYSVLTNAFRVLALQMNEEKLCGGRAPKFVTNKDLLCQKSDAKKKGLRIVKLSESGRAKLHRNWLSGCLSPVQEAWIILHAKKLHCGLFLEPEKVDKKPTGVTHVVSPNEGSGTYKGGANTYQQRDVEFFRRSLEKILFARQEEKKKPIKERFMYFDFPEAVDGDKVTTGSKRLRAGTMGANEPPYVPPNTLALLKEWNTSKRPKQN